MTERPKADFVAGPGGPIRMWRAQLDGLDSVDDFGPADRRTAASHAEPESTDRLSGGRSGGGGWLVWRGGARGRVLGRAR